MQTESFGVIAAIPTLALLYIVGVLISTISDLIFQILRPKKWSKEWQVMGYVINSQNSALVSTFFEMHRKKKNIEGSIFPLCILGLGIYLEHTNLPDLRSPLILASASVIAISLLLPLFSNRIQKDINQLVEIAKAAE
ncbi:MAG: hypothetical protein GKR95_07585 [Gammaproteobacteria bacterium]|nr:hypothetical protein [Gammaproteobacteria bacterium]